MNAWEMKPLGEDGLLLGVHPGFACGKKDITGGVPHLRMNNISKDGLIEMSLVRRIPRDVAEARNRFAEPGDILFNNTNSTELVGKSCIFTGWQERCTFSNHLTRIRPNAEKLCVEWLFMCLRDMWLQGYFAANCVEFVGQSAFNKDKLLELKIPVPPLSEQRRIVARVEALTGRLKQARQARQAALAEAETVFQRALEDAFADEITEDWREVPVEQLFEVVSGQFSPLDPKFKHLPYLGPEHIESGTGRIIGERRSVEELKMRSGKYLFTPEHIVYSKIRPALRKVCLPDYTGLCSADMYALKPNIHAVKREFLLFLLLAPPFSQYAVDNSDRNAMPKINRETLFGFTFHLPEIPEQERIAKLLLTLRSKTDELQRLQREVETELAAFVPALLAKAFRGEL